MGLYLVPSLFVKLPIFNCHMRIMEIKIKISRYKRQLFTDLQFKDQKEEGSTFIDINQLNWKQDNYKELASLWMK